MCSDAVLDIYYFAAAEIIIGHQPTLAFHLMLDSRIWLDTPLVMMIIIYKCKNLIVILSGAITSM